MNIFINIPKPAVNFHKARVLNILEISEVYLVTCCSFYVGYKWCVANISKEKTHVAEKTFTPVNVSLCVDLYHDLLKLYSELNVPINACSAAYVFSSDVYIHLQYIMKSCIPSITYPYMLRVHVCKG